MDLYCCKCGEPMDFHEFESHEERKAFRDKGCAGVSWLRDCEGDGTSFEAMAMSAMGDLMGDDIDGIAASLDDLL